MSQNVSDAFVCWYCEKTLINNPYIVKENFAICLPCFEERYSLDCFQCHRIIGLETAARSFQSKTWHDACFNCSICEGSLLAQRFAFRNDRLYCRSCLINQFARRCDRCNRPLEPGEKCTEYQKKFYHKSCFVCHACHQPLINDDFRRRDQYYLCLSCYLHRVAIYCIQCHKAIETDGILYHNQPFHGECFLCTHCTKPLGKQGYVEYENEAYCSVCSMSWLHRRK